MIEKLSKIAKNLFWIKPIAYLCGIGFFSLFLFILLSGSSKDSDVYLIPSVLGVIWSLLLLAMESIFSNIPSKVNPLDGFFTRLKTNFKRGAYHLFGWFFILLSIAIIWLSTRMFFIWF